MADPLETTPFERELLARFSGTFTTEGGEVWVRHQDAEAAIDLAQARGLRVLGMEGFVVGENVYPSMSRIIDYSPPGYQGCAYDDARALLVGPWATIPDDMHGDAEGPYMIGIVVAD